MSRLDEVLGSLPETGQAGEPDLRAVIASLGRDTTAALIAYRKYSQDRGVGAVALDTARHEALLYGHPLDHSTEISATEAE